MVKYQPVSVAVAPVNVGVGNFDALAKTKPPCLAETEAKNGILVT